MKETPLFIDMDTLLHTAAETAKHLKSGKISALRFVGAIRESCDKVLAMGATEAETTRMLMTLLLVTSVEYMGDMPLGSKGGN